jgi:ribonuclease BN (tRNA processing enzyme)
VSLTLTVLGSAGSHPQAGRVCSGYLVTADGTSVLLDAGNGSTANLLRFVDWSELDGVAVSHRHVDHCIDLVGAFYAMRFAAPRSERLPLHAPAEVAETLRGLLSSDSAHRFDDVFAAREVAAGDRSSFGPVEIEYFASEHPPPSVSMRVSVDDRVLAYSGDSAGGPGLVECASGADLLLCEASWAGDPSGLPTGVHLTARGAAEVATAAGVDRLLLTHVAGGTDRDLALREAREHFAGPVELAEDLAVHRLA